MVVFVKRFRKLFSSSRKMQTHEPNLSVHKKFHGIVLNCETSGYSEMLNVLPENVECQNFAEAGGKMNVLGNLVCEGVEN